MLLWSVLIYGETAYIFSYTHVLNANIFSLLWSENLQILSNFCWPYTQCELYRKAKFWEDSKSQDKTQFENRHKSHY